MPSIDFRHLPQSVGGFSRLFNDYLYDFPSVKDFFAGDFRTLENVGDIIEKRRAAAHPRSTIVEPLLAQNAGFGCGPRALENVRRLGEENTFCVVTGQQVGLLGGPLYTLHKLHSTIKLTHILSGKFPSFNFVPVFWLEGEDHDLAEVNHVSFLNQENTPVRIDYLVDGRPVQRNLGAVGEITIGSSIEDVFLEIERVLAPSDFRANLLKLARSSYVPGRTLNHAFVQWILALFSHSPQVDAVDPGIVFISSNDIRIKQILKPVLEKEIQEYPRTSQLVIGQSAHLEKKYHAQIKPKAVNLFMFHKGGRYLIEPRENGFSLKGTRHFVRREELLCIASETPELLSPNVVLRPICQDSLLPTVAYVAGPSEIAYFAQLKPVYEYFNVPMPIIYPRASITIIEQKLQIILEKYQLDFLEFFGQKEKVNERVIELLSEVNLDELLTATKKRIDEILAEMRFGLTYIDSTLDGSLESTRARIQSQLDVLKEKAGTAQRRKHEIALRQIDKVFSNVFPNGSYQERELNVIHFMNKYGLDFPRWLFDHTEVETHAHQILEL
jgi:bacillithiol biosynthesis cysteine-adding enzyme BshC